VEHFSLKELQPSRVVSLSVYHPQFTRDFG